MKKMLLPMSLCLGGVAILYADAAAAMPLDAASPNPGLVVTIGWRCGPGWHLDYWGNCRPNRFYWGSPWGYGGYGYGWRQPYGWGWHYPYGGGWYHGYRRYGWGGW